MHMRRTWGWQALAGGDSCGRRRLRRHRRSSTPVGPLNQFHTDLVQAREGEGQEALVDSARLPGLCMVGPFRAFVGPADRLFEPFVEAPKRGGFPRTICASTVLEMPAAKAVFDTVCVSA